MHGIIQQFRRCQQFLVAAICIVNCATKHALRNYWQCSHEQTVTCAYIANYYVPSPGNPQVGCFTIQYMLILYIQEDGIMITTSVLVFYGVLVISESVWWNWWWVSISGYKE